MFYHRGSYPGDMNENFSVNEFYFGVLWDRKCFQIIYVSHIFYYASHALPDWTLAMKMQHVAICVQSVF